MTIDALNSALAGLNVTKAQIDLISQNIANAQTAGYTDKQSTQTTGPLGPVLSAGSSGMSTSSSSNLSTARPGPSISCRPRSLCSRQIETSFGAPSADSSLASAITNLQNAFQDLSVNPEQSTLFNSVLDQATAVANSLNSLSQTVSGTNSGATRRCSRPSRPSTTRCNPSIRSTSRSLQPARADTTTLQDQRDQALSTLSGFMNITTFNKPNGEVAVYTADGKPLVDATAATITTNGNAIDWNMPPSAPAAIRSAAARLLACRPCRTPRCRRSSRSSTTSPVP